MNDKFIRVRARVELLPSSEGGRAVPIQGSYRPNHNFSGPDDRSMTVGFLELAEGRQLHPGESIELAVTFWHWPGLENQVYPGRQWRIQEGAQLVGTGTVIEILPATS